MCEIVLFTISVHHFCYREAEGGTVMKVKIWKAKTLDIFRHFLYNKLNAVVLLVASVV